MISPNIFLVRENLCFFHTVCVKNWFDEIFLHTGSAHYFVKQTWEYNYLRDFSRKNSVVSLIFCHFCMIFADLQNEFTEKLHVSMKVFYKFHGIISEIVHTWHLSVSPIKDDFSSLFSRLNLLSFWFYTSFFTNHNMLQKSLHEFLPIFSKVLICFDMF